MKSILALLTVFGLAYATDSSAQIFKLRVTDYGLPTSNPAYGAFKDIIDTEITKVEAEINKDLPSAPPQRLMEGMANSSVMAGKGIGSDYASRMNVFLIGAGIGAGADLAKDKTTDSDISGAGVAPGLIIGANLSFLDTKTILGMDTDRLNAYINFMNYTYKHKLNDKPDERSEAELEMMAFGVHFKYDWIQGSGSKWLGWGGVKFHFGYEYNSTNIIFSSQINEDVNTSGNGYDVTGTIRGNPRATIESSTHSIPIELSTDVQLLYFLSLYTGIGADYNFGQAQGKGSLNADPSTVSCSGGAGCTTAGNPDATVQAEANVDATGKVNPFLFRGFAGVQLNLPYVVIFGQVDKAFGNDLIGATAGLRFVY